MVMKLVPIKLTQEQELMIESVKKFCEENIVPVQEKLEKGELPPYNIIRKFLQEILGTEEINTVDDLEKMREQRQKEWLTYTLAMIEFTKYSPSVALSMGASVGLFGGTVFMHGTKEQKGKYCIPVFKGEKIGAFGLTEPEAGSDAFSLKTKAVKDGDYYILNGTKTFITNAPYADYFIIYAKTNPEAPGHRGVTAFILERGMEGLSTSQPFKKMGMKGSPTGQVYMDDVKVHKSQILGTPERGFYEVRDTLKEERAGTPGMAIAIIERCLEISLKYASERAQFGQNIIFFQAIQFKLARMFMHLQNCYALLFWLKKLQEEGEEKLAMASAAASKIYSSEAALECALEAVQILGGYGYTQDYPVEMLARDAKLLMIGGGTNEIQHLIVTGDLAREFLGFSLKGV